MTDEGEMVAGRYRLISQVGAGAMGVVWQAHDERLHRIVAVKQLLLHAGTSALKTDEAKRRAMREGRITARLHHPHAITVYDVAEHHGRPCLIMEYLRSESLAAVLSTRGALHPEEVARIGSQITSALAAAHAAGIVHRDIKPGNVLIGEDGTAKITDFGISRAVGDGTVTATGVLAGTPAYFAPEVAKGRDADFPADVFSLGATLYAAVEGEPPFGLDDNAIALLFRITTSEIAPPRRAGPLTPVLTQTLESDPSQRPTMRQVHEALTAVAERRQPAVDAPSATAALPPQIELRVPAPDPPPEGNTRQPSRKAIAVVAVVVVLLAVGLLATAIVNQGADRAAGPASTTSDSPQGQQAPPPSPTVDNTPTPAPTTPKPAAPAPVTPAPATPSPPVANAAAPQATPELQGAAVSEYYALVPGNLQAGWARLTRDYQRSHAGGFASYQSFWAAVERVDVSGVSVTQPGTVQATLNYFYQDGRVVEERTSFGLVAEDGIWKIGNTAVLSSRSKN